MNKNQEKSECFILFGVPICLYRRTQLENALVSFFSSEKAYKVAKVNTEFLDRALKNKEFKNMLANFDLNIADGSGVLWAARYLTLPLTQNKVILRLPLRTLIISAQAVWQMVYSGASLVFYPKYVNNPIPERFPGVEAMYLMLEAAQKTSTPVYFLGAEKEVNEKARWILAKKFPNLMIAGGKGGFWKSDTEVIEEINKSGANLLIVALGSPKQEYWIRDNTSKLTTVRVAVGEGGSLDQVVGSAKPAPKWVKRLGIEWFWRLLTHKGLTPAGGHRAKRVWNAVPVFIYNVVKYKIQNAK